MRKLARALVVVAIAVLIGGSVTAPAHAQDDVPAFGSTAGQGDEAAADDAAAGDGEDEQRTFAELYGYGGWIMHVLVALSVVVLGLTLERMIALRTNAVIPRKFMGQVMGHWRKGDIQQVSRICGASSVSIARVLRAGLIHYDEGLARMEDAVEAAGDHEATILRRNLGLIAALGNIATMIGLLGTVLGMITAFDVIAKTGTGDASVVAGGIFQALITTAAGLMVGITAIGAHSFLRRRVEVLEINLEETSFRLIEELSRPGVESTSDGREARDTGSLAPAGA